MYKSSQSLMKSLGLYWRTIRTGLIASSLFLSTSGSNNHNSFPFYNKVLEQTKPQIQDLLVTPSLLKETLDFKSLTVAEHVANIQTLWGCEKIDIQKWADEHNIDLNKFGPRLVKAAIFRQYYHDNVQSTVDTFEAKFGSNHMNLEYHLIISSILASIWEKSSNNTDTLMLPTPMFFSTLTQKHDIKQLQENKKKKWNDISRVISKTTESDIYNFEQSYGIFRKYNQMCVGYDQVAKYLQSMGVELRSTSKRNEEDGSSMDYYRTGTEMEVHSYRNLQKIIALFRADHPDLPLFISGLKEYGHSCDDQVSHSNKNFWEPKHTMSAVCLSQSHIMGHAVDIKMMGADGLILYNRLRTHTLDPVKKDIQIGKMHIFKYNGIQFKYMFHGEGVIGKHFHIVL